MRRNTAASLFSIILLFSILTSNGIPFHSVYAQQLPATPQPEVFETPSTGQESTGSPSDSASSSDCLPGTGWRWVTGPEQPETALQAQAILWAKGIESTVTAVGFGEEDSCGTFHLHSTDFNVILQGDSAQKVDAQAQLSGAIVDALFQFAKPQLGNVQIGTTPYNLKTYQSPTRKQELAAAALEPSIAEAPVFNKKVFLLVYNPVMENGQDLITYKNWFSYSTLVSGIINTFLSVSHGQLQYTVASTMIVDEWPVKTDGFRYTPTTYPGGPTNAQPHSPDSANYDAIIDDPRFDICGQVNRGEIDELWIYAGPYFGFYESRLVGPNAYWYNSPAVSGTHNCARLLPIMGLSYERGLTEAIESFGHRTESTMTKVYGSWQENRTAHNWDRFGLDQAQSPNYSYSGCGSVHYAPTSTKDYEWGNTRTVNTNCEDFKNYPNLSDPLTVLQPVTCSAWKCNGLDYFKYWYSHFPWFAGFGPDMVANNWWEYFADPGKALTYFAPPSAFNKTGPGNGASTDPTSTLLTWSNSTGKETYDYCYDTVDDGVCNSSWLTLSTSIVKLIDLNYNTTYYWQARAHNHTSITEADGGAWFSFHTYEIACPAITNWKGEYWSNSDLSGDRALCRDDFSLRFDWETGSPDSSLPEDHFSARWTRILNFPYNTYRFWMDHDDGVRLYIDTELRMDNWDSASQMDSTDILLSGYHEIRVEMRDISGAAHLNFGWEPLQISGWRGEYFNNTDWSGAPILVRDDSAVNFDWQASSPHPLVKADGFSAQWTRTLSFPAGSYTFFMKHSDGARLFIDDVPVFENLCVDCDQKDSINVDLSEGNHTIRYGIFDSAGNASSRLTWLSSFNKSGPENGATITSVTPTMTWQASSGRTGSAICYDQTNDNKCDTTYINTGTATSYTTSRLPLDTTYYWQVKALNDLGSIDADNGDWWSFTTPPAPGSFNKLSPSNGPNKQPINLVLDWEDSANTTRYEYCYDTSNDAYCTNWISTGSASQVPLTLSYAATYYWQVRAVNSFATVYANGSSAAFWTFTTLPAPPAAFNKSSPFSQRTGLSINPTLFWNSSSTAKGYEYCYDTSDDNACDNWISVSTNSAGLSGLSYDTTYYWQVRAVNDGGSTYANGSPTAYWSFTTRQPAVAGQFSKQSPANGFSGANNTLDLIWNPVSGVDSYLYCYTSIPGGDCAWTSTDTTSASLSGLNYSTQYYWQVKAVNEFGASPADDDVWWSFTTQPQPPDPFNKTSPSNQEGIMSMNPTLIWTEGEVAASYSYCYDTVDNGECDSSWITTAAPSAALDGLTSHTTYYWQVRAVNPGGTIYADDSAWWSFTTPSPAPILDKVQPGYATVGIDALVITLYGSNFIPDSVVLWNNEPADTIYISPNKLEAIIDKQGLQASSSKNVKVSNPEPAGGLSGVQTVQLIVARPLSFSRSASLRPEFYWEPVDGATSYLLQVAATPTFSTYLLSVNVPTNSYKPAADLPREKGLYWRVGFYLGSTFQGWFFDYLSFGTPNPPSAPILRLPQAGSLSYDYTPLFDWTDPTFPSGIKLNGYIIEVARDQNFDDLVERIDAGVSRSTPPVELAPNTRYYWRVFAYNSFGEYSISKTGTFRTVMAQPGLSSPINGDLLTTNRPVLDWEDVPGASSYTIQITTGSFGSPLKTISAAASKVVILTDLPRNRVLYWRVRANGVNGPSIWSKTGTFKTGNPPSVPVLKLPGSSSIIYNYQPLFDWSESSAPGGTYLSRYQIQIGRTTQFDPPLIDAFAFSSDYRPNVALESNNVYYWRVRAYNTNDHYSGWSAVRSFKTAPEKPVNLSPANGETLTGRRPVFDWEDIPGATSYVIMISTSSSFSTYLVNRTVTVSEYGMLADLPLNRTLYWRVRAKAATGYSQWSDRREFTIAP